MNNQGLEALAALAATVSAGMSSNNIISSNSNDNNNTPVTNPSNRSPATDHPSSSQGNAAAAQAPDFAKAVQNAASLFQSAQNVTPQQWQQFLSAAAGTTSMVSPVMPNMQQNNQPDQSALITLQQQLALYQRLAQTQLQGVSQSQQSCGTVKPLVPTASNPALEAAQAMQFAFSSQQSQPSFLHVSADNTQQVSNQGSTATNANSLKTSHSANTSQKSVAIAVGTQPVTNNVVGRSWPIPLIAAAGNVSAPSMVSQLQIIAPQPSTRSDDDLEDDHSITYHHTGDKKQQKRAANRRSAQLSRKRKKAFIEELKEENDDLRRKEQILKSIPDLVVVFDSSGKLWFVSQSVNRFLDFTSRELEGSSFWTRLCDDSVRLLKAAFMDSLAARNAESDTAPLGSGFWELRLVDRDGSQKIVTLNGVVHFAGDRPECVCSIRPQENLSTQNTTSDLLDSASSSSILKHKSLIRVQPQQSVISNGNSDSVVSSRHRVLKGGDAVRISDSGNSSGSETGSSEELVEYA